jgi:hypothetical protein
MRYILKTFNLLKKNFTTNNKSLSLVPGEMLKNLTKDNNKLLSLVQDEEIKKLTNDENKEYNNLNNRNNKLKIYGPESNTLHAWEDDV